MSGATSKLGKRMQSDYEGWRRDALEADLADRSFDVYGLLPFSEWNRRIDADVSRKELANHLADGGWWGIF